MKKTFFGVFVFMAMFRFGGFAENNENLHEYAGGAKSL